MGSVIDVALPENSYQIAIGPMGIASRTGHQTLDEPVG